MNSLAVAWSEVFELNVRHAVVALNILAIIGLVIYAIFSLRGTKHDEPSQNLTPFLPDEDLEGPRLERVMGWTLFFAAIIAISLPVYWLREPTRQDDSFRTFDEQAIARGEVLFSNSAMESYDSAVSLQCANCHGADGGGGSAPSTQEVDGEPAAVTYRAPALDTVLYRFSPDEVTRIITYGRPGTPMQAWGIDGNGPKNSQSIADLVAYLTSIQISPEEAQAQAEAALDDWRDAPDANVEAATTERDDARDAAEKAIADRLALYEGSGAALESALAEWDEARTALADAQADVDAFATLPDASQDDIDAADAALDAAQASADEAAAGLTPTAEATEALRYAADKNVDDTAIALERSEEALANVTEFASRRQGVTDGQLLFELNCARCHTRGWSWWDPTTHLPEDVIGAPGGNGTTGFNLRDGAVARRFPPVVDDNGDVVTSTEEQVQGFITNGDDNDVGYGNKGIGNGRMPGQCNTALAEDENIALVHYGCALTEAMIEQIADYELNHLDETDERLAAAG